MKTLDNKLIIYDSNCKVCSSLRKVVLKLTSIREEKVKAFGDLSSKESIQVDTSQFKNGMALIDTTGGETLYGTEGIAYIFSSQYKPVDLLLRFKPLYSLFSFIYRTQAYNRYIVATPKSKFKCDCFPDVNVKYRIAYVLIALVVSVMLTISLGISLRKFVNIPAHEAAMQMLLIAGTGWVIQIILGSLFLKEKALDYIGHLGSIMMVGLFIQVPWILFSFITGIEFIYLPVLSLICSSAYMFYLHVHRTRYLGISQWWTVSWFLLLQITASSWIYFFYLK